MGFNANLKRAKRTYRWMKAKMNKQERRGPNDMCRRSDLRLLLKYRRKAK